MSSSSASGTSSPSNSPSSSQRPRFEPIPCDSSSELLQAYSYAPLKKDWVPLIACPVDFPAEIFEVAVTQLIDHPEYNSTLILRSETIKEYLAPSPSSSSSGSAPTPSSTPTPSPPSSSDSTPPSNSDSDPDFPPLVPRLENLTPRRCIHRRLLPRRPGRDSALEQLCTLYAPAPGPSDSRVELDDPQGCVDTMVLTPIVGPGEALPYYHPAVSHLAFRYISPPPSLSPTSSSPTTPLLLIEAAPLPSPTSQPTPSPRLHRTALALLDALHRYAWGARVAYQKRVLHDRLVGREEYQDLYLVMRERYKRWVGAWCEVTDPLKHVFEDIGIATYLMLLWKYTYSSPSDPSSSSSTSSSTNSSPGSSLGSTTTAHEPHNPTPAPNSNANAYANEPWKSWPRPPGGFLDLGCGNGLLTHILTAEGYTGRGIDLRARASWGAYPESTRRVLSVRAVDPTDESGWITESAASEAEAEAGAEGEADEEGGAEQGPGPEERQRQRQRQRKRKRTNKGKGEGEGVFIIGNHADELTPWIPVLATLWRAAGYLSIPCCAWAHEARWVRGAGAGRVFPGGGGSGAGGSSGGSSGGAGYASDEGIEAKGKGKGKEEAWIKSLNLGTGSDINKSSYSMYRIWLAELSLYCGWEVECDVLRIPSTRNWAIVGRTRLPASELSHHEALERARGIVRDVKARGGFRTRRPEGKAGEH